MWQNLAEMAAMGAVDWQIWLERRDEADGLGGRLGIGTTRPETPRCRTDIGRPAYLPASAGSKSASARTSSAGGRLGAPASETLACTVNPVASAAGSSPRPTR